jgi:hypothetical protein
VKITTGQVVEGEIALDGAVPPDGSTVLVLVLDTPDVRFQVTASEKAFLLAALAAGEHGERMDGFELLERLKSSDEDPPKRAR